jgi:hypothetical protein
MVAGGALAAPKPPAYNGPASQVQQGIAGEQASGTLGALPFTGLDLALIVGGGLVLLLAGVSLRRVAARNKA